MRSSKGLLSVLAGAAMLAAGCESGAGPVAGPLVRSPAGVVPWVNRPAPAYQPPPLPKPTAAYPRCRAPQLVGRPGRGGAAAGTFYQQVRLTNRSSVPCTLSGGPAAVTGILVTGGSTTLTRTAFGGGLNLVGSGPANVRPGQSGWVTLAWGDGCPAITAGDKAGYRTLFIVFRSGRVRVHFPVTLNLVCGLEASKFGAPPPVPPDTRSPLNVLTATVTAPVALSAGSTASYIVKLANRSGISVRLAPCPSYAESLVVFRGPGRLMYTVRRYYLNCAAAEQIPARGSVTFAMRMPVPAGTGKAKLDWQLQGAEVATAIVVTIRGSS